jgi:hypothetical protein
MKRIILLLIVLMVYASNSQDRFPTVPYSYNVPNYGNMQINANTPPYKQTEFLRGWQWGANPELSEAMYCNQANINSEVLTRMGTNYFFYSKKFKLVVDCEN